MNLWKYSNGTGHLIMSVVTVVTGVIMIMSCQNNPSIQATGVMLILTVNSTWFVLASAKSIATEVTNNISSLTQVAHDVKPIIQEVLDAKKEIVTGQAN